MAKHILQNLLVTSLNLQATSNLQNTTYMQNPLNLQTTPDSQNTPNVPNSASSQSMQTASLARGYRVALLSAMVLSLTAIFIRYLTENYHLPPLVLAFWRDGFTALFLIPVLGLVRRGLLRVQRQHLLYLVLYGFALAIFNSFWTLSVALNGAAVATVLVYCSAAFTALLGRFLLKEHLGLVKLMAVLFSLGGCALISGVAGNEAVKVDIVVGMPGVVIGVISGLCYAIYSLMGRSASQRGLNPWTTLLYTFGFAALFLFVFNFLPWEQMIGGAAGQLIGAANGLTDFFWLGSSLWGWGILLLLAIGPTVLGFGLYNVSLVHLPSSVANLIATTEPVFTAVVAYFLLGERLTQVQLVGSVMVVAGVLFLRIYEGWVARQRNSAST